MTDAEQVARWLILVIGLPADPSRHHVAVWRELRRVGALSLGQGFREMFTAALSDSATARKWR
uniref:Chromate resistance protein ChrB n=1 Tax=Streptomyces sp. SJL17-4 TaxID=2967224 RepID=UPI00403FD360